MRTEPSFSSEPVNLQPGDVDGSESDFNFSHEHHAESQLLSDYRQRYGLSVDPFADDPHFPLYTGAQRRQILDQLLHLSQFSNNLLVVLGEYGVGKTRIAQALIDSLDDADDICFLEGQITSSFDSLFKNIIEQYELSDAQEFADFTRRQSENDGLAVLMVDNAHHLTDAVLIELIGLIQSGAESRVHLVLFAEPHLLPRLEHLDIPEVTLSDFHLEKFSLSETVDYLNFRMEMADYLGPEIFTEPKVEPLWRQSRGQLLRLHEYAQDKLLASVSTPQNFDRNKKGSPVFYIVGASVLGAALFMGYMYWGALPVVTQLPRVTEPTPITKATESSHPLMVSSVQEPVMLHEGVNSVQALASGAPEKFVDSELVSASVESTQIPVQEKALGVPTVKQNVVPLVQAKAVQQELSTMPTKSNNIASAKEIKKLDTPQPTINVVNKVAGSRADKIKNTPGGTGYSEQEKNILSWSESEFTLQVVGLSSEKAVHDYMAEQPNKKDLLVFKSSRQGKAWFVVVTGRYSSSANARQAAQLLPESQRKAAPWPRDLKTIQKEITKR